MPSKADELLAGIEAICRSGTESERRASYFMFGTDWIMLAQIPRHKRYIDAFDAAIHRSTGFWLP